MAIDNKEDAMMRPLCTVFVDAFSFAAYSKLKNDPLDSGYCYKLLPGIGYSSNLHYAIFQGKSPDDVGFFTDYAYIPRVADTSPSKAFAILDQVDAANSCVRYLRRIITKRNDNIPFSESRHFHKSSMYLFQEGSSLSLFGRESIVINNSNVDHAFDDAVSKVESGERNIAVVINELDELGHQYGSSSIEYEAAASHILDRSQDLFSRFETACPEGARLLISDHGMADEYAAVNIVDGLYERFGLPGEHYFFFCDSVYLRVWSDERAVLNNLRSFFSHIDCLVLVDADERRRFGVTKRVFGDLIYRLRQGYVFKPNCFGLVLKRSARGIHGYMEPTDEASGIVVCSSRLGDGGEMHADKVYDAIVRGIA